MNTVSLLKAIEQVIGNRYLAEHHKLTLPVAYAIKEGYVIDVDPYWFNSDKYNIRPKVILSALGEQVAIQNGYVCTCCTEYKNRSGRDEIIVKFALPYNDYLCDSCRTVVMAHGIKEGMCRAHYERLRRQIELK